MKTNDLYLLMQMQVKDLEESLEKYLDEVNNGNTFLPLFMNKDYGKTAVKRKITTLRQTLLRISEEIK